jgi:hypothetical protein
MQVGQADAPTNPACFKLTIFLKGRNGVNVVCILFSTSKKSLFAVEMAMKVLTRRFVQGTVARQRALKSSHTECLSRLYTEKINFNQELFANFFFAEQKITTLRKLK